MSVHRSVHLANGATTGARAHCLVTVEEDLMRPRSWPALAAAAAMTLVMAGAAVPASAHETVAVDDGALDSAVDAHHHHQHGGDEGHLPATRDNVNVVGKAAINQDQPGRVADVGVFGNYAYLAAFWEPTCQKGGVYVFDIADVSRPKQVNFIRTSNDSYVGEGVHIVHIDTPKFTGDVLAFNNEICGTNQHANGGMTLVDVTDPKVHRYLSQHTGDVGADGAINEIHSVFIWDAGDKAYAVIVDDEEDADVDLMDITDPRKPVKIAEYDLATMFPSILQTGVGLDSVFHHDMVVKKIGNKFMMLVSYWDAGYVVLDVTNPVKPKYVADTDFAFPDPEAAESGLTVDPEGNAHEAEFTLDNKFIVAADEDFTSFKGKVNNDEGTEFDAIRGDAVPGIPQGGSIAGNTVYVGRACPGDPAVPAGNGSQIALVERGVCDFQVKYDAVLAAGGYTAVLVFNREQGAADGCDTLITMLLHGDVPAFFVTRRVGFDLLDLPYDHAACLAGDGSTTASASVGTIGDAISMTSSFDGWGYVHLYRNGGGKLAELDTYAIPEAHDPAFGTGSGDLSVHEAATSLTDSRLVYFAYYAGGFRVARITADNKIVETGRFIDTGGNNFWGAQVFTRGNKEYVAASDRDYGLYIFEYTGP